MVIIKNIFLLGNLRELFHGMFNVASLRKPSYPRRVFFTNILSWPYMCLCSVLLCLYYPHIHNYMYSLTADNIGTLYSHRRSH